MLQLKLLKPNGEKGLTVIITFKVPKAHAIEDCEQSSDDKMYKEKHLKTKGLPVIPEKTKRISKTIKTKILPPNTAWFANSIK